MAAGGTSLGESHMKAVINVNLYDLKEVPLDKRKAAFRQLPLRSFHGVSHVSF